MAWMFTSTTSTPTTALHAIDAAHCQQGHGTHTSRARRPRLRSRARRRGPARPRSPRTESSCRRGPRSRAGGRRTRAAARSRGEAPPRSTRRRRRALHFLNQLAPRRPSWPRSSSPRPTPAPGPRTASSRPLRAHLTRLASSPRTSSTSSRPSFRTRRSRHNRSSSLYYQACRWRRAALDLNCCLRRSSSASFPARCLPALP
mmetsp:Transcript_22248/g.58125  ORF Transcript_22248/g.58125 Transcript_22248/m.58125 type:complete len:202 (-) Transcript_22248:491-1096(-)